jgi:glyceraldehyde 3-phosphate dehydrogenase
MVVGGSQVKMYAWYDNERGYANRLVDLAALAGRGLDRVAVGAAAAG